MVRDLASAYFSNNTALCKLSSFLPICSLEELSQNTLSQSPLIPLPLLSSATADSFYSQCITVYTFTIVYVMSVLYHCTCHHLEGKTPAPPMLHHQYIFTSSAPSTLCCTSRAISNICWINEWHWPQIGSKATERKVGGTKDKFCLGWFLPFLLYIPSQNVPVLEKRNLKYLLKIGLWAQDTGLQRQLMDGILNILPST